MLPNRSAGSKRRIRRQVDQHHGPGGWFVKVYADFFSAWSMAEGAEEHSVASFDCS